VHQHRVCIIGPLHRVAADKMVLLQHCPCSIEIALSCCIFFDVWYGSCIK